MKSADYKEQNYQFKTNINMKTKTSILALTKAFFILLVMCCFSCNHEPIENYKGSVIYLKENPPAGMRFEIKYKTKEDKYDFKTVYVLEPDWQKYRIGDTIK